MEGHEKWFCQNWGVPMYLFRGPQNEDYSLLRSPHVGKLPNVVLRRMGDQSVPFNLASVPQLGFDSCCWHLLEGDLPVFQCGWQAVSSFFLQTCLSSVCVCVRKRRARQPNATKVASSSAS